MDMWIGWLIAAGIFLIGEIISVGFILMMPAIAALIACGAAALGASPIWQMAIFCVATTILLLFIRPLMRKAFKAETENKSDEFTVIGKEGRVIETVTDEGGKVLVDGEMWTAVSGEPIEVDARVKVTEIIGVKVRVEKITL